MDINEENCNDSCNNFDDEMTNMLVMGVKQRLFGGGGGGDGGGGDGVGIWRTFQLLVQCQTEHIYFMNIGVGGGSEK